MRSPTAVVVTMAFLLLVPVCRADSVCLLYTSIAKNLESVEDPRRFGKPYLSIKGAWRYRVGDYRFVCLIQNEKLIVLVLKIGHRRDVYD